MNNDRDEEIKALIEELQNLQLRIGIVSHRLRNLEDADSKVDKVSDRRSKRDRDSGSVRTESIVFEAEDVIRVKNPSKGQVDKGVVTGYRKNGYISIELDNGIKTCRDKKNLELIKKA